MEALSVARQRAEEEKLEALAALRQRDLQVCWHACASVPMSGFVCMLARTPYHAGQGLQGLHDLSSQMSSCL